MGTTGPDLSPLIPYSPTRKEPRDSVLSELRGTFRHPVYDPPSDKILSPVCPSRSQDPSLMNLLNRIHRPQPPDVLDSVLFHGKIRSKLPTGLRGGPGSSGSRVPGIPQFQVVVGLTPNDGVGLFRCRRN